MSSASEPVLSSSEESVEEFETSDDSSSEEEDRKGVSKPTSHRAPPKHDDDSDAEKKFKLSTHTDAFDYEATLKQLKQLTSMSVSEAAALDKHTSSLHLLSSTTALHQHQVIALKWLANLWNKECGGIVGDLMGLGKTLEAITLIAYALGEAKATGPILVVCPLSVIMNWMSEFHRFAPKIRVQKYHGSKDERAGVQAKVREHVMAQPKEQRKDPSFDFDVMVTNYETLLSDVDFLGRFRWRLAVIDEAHRLKNYHSRTFQTLKLRYAITRCVLLTGTPIQNNLAELYALLALAVPAVFPIGAADSFVKQFKNAVDKDGKKTEGRPLRDADLSVSQLQALLTPILLRRTLADVGVDLPPLTETVVQCPMTAMQKHWYLSVLEGHVSQLVVASSGSRSSTLGLQNVVMQLRKVCNHPYLFPGAEPEPFEEGDHIFQNSGKAWVLDRLLLRLRSEGHKVLLFSQSTHMLDILQDYMSYRGWNYERLDGSVRSEERWTSVQRFQRSASVVSANSMAKDEEAFVFLLSTRAGGVGLNLTNADTVILYDSDWNPQADLQAIGRAHRIGQTKPVRVIRLMTVNSVEEVILRRALLKLQLTKKVMSGGALTGLADTADDDQEDTVQQADSASLLRMIQFGLSKLTSQDPIELSNKLVDAALASASDTADVIDVSASVSSSSVTEAAPTVSPAEPGGADATVSLVDIEAAASQLQESLYGYEGKEYKPTARADEDVAVLDAITAGSNDLDAAAIAKLAARKAAAVESSRAKTPTRPSPAQPPKPRQPRPPKRPKAAPSDTESDLSPSDEDKKPKIKKAKVHAKLPPKDTDYVSNLLPQPDSTALMVDEDSTMMVGLEYVIGDATQPSPNTTRQLTGKDGESFTTQDTTAVTLHCVDTSGRWGAGGMFTAINNLDKSVGRAYERAGRNHDLHLGDTHLVGVQTSPFAPWQGRQFIALLVVLDRDASGQLVLDSLALKTALDRLAGWMMEPGSSCDGMDVASVHTPRIGARMPGISWYSVEHTLQRYLCQRGIRTVVYYFQRPGSGPGTLVTSPSFSRPSTPLASPKPSSPHERAVASRLDHWLRQGAENLALAHACPDWRDNVQFVFSQPREAVQSALDSLSTELKSTTDANKRVSLEFFANVMTDVLCDKKK